MTSASQLWMNEHNLLFRCEWMNITCLLGSISGSEEGNRNEFNLEVANRCGGEWHKASDCDVGRHWVGWHQPWNVACRCIYLGLHSLFIFFKKSVSWESRSGWDSTSGSLEYLPLLTVSTHLWYLSGCHLTWLPLISIVIREQRNLPWRKLVSEHCKVYDFWSSVQKTRASMPQMLWWWENYPASLRYVS